MSKNLLLLLTVLVIFLASSGTFIYIGSMNADRVEDIDPSAQTMIIPKLPDPATMPTATVSPAIPVPVSNVSTKLLPTAMPTGDDFQRIYTWSYKNVEWTFNTKITREAYNYYKNLPHTSSSYANYALTDEDRPYLQDILNKFTESGTRYGYSDYDNVMNVVIFVQSLPYTSDSVTTGFDEYPRYPIETLADNGGDCEDTSILTAALLKEMGYDIVLLKFPNHMAIGVHVDGAPGTYCEYNSVRYYYLETTGDGWKIGEVPEEYINDQPEVCPLIKSPQMNLNFTVAQTDMDDSYVYYRVNCIIKNNGREVAANARLHMMAMALSRGKDMIWQPDVTVDLGDYRPEQSGTAEGTLKVPRNETSEIVCVLYGDNFGDVELKTVTFNT